MKNERNFCLARGAKVSLARLSLPHFPRPSLPSERETDGIGRLAATLNGRVWLWRVASSAASLSLSLSLSLARIQGSRSLRRRSVPLCHFDTGQLPDFLFRPEFREERGGRGSGGGRAFQSFDGTFRKNDPPFLPLWRPSSRRFYSFRLQSSYNVLPEGGFIVVGQIPPGQFDFWRDAHSKMTTE